MKTLVLLATVLMATVSQAYTCTASKDDGQQVYNVTMKPVLNGPVIDGLVRVQLTKMDDVSFVVWESGPFAAGVPSQHLFANIYDESGSASKLGEATLTKDGSALLLQFNSSKNKQNFSLVCVY